MTNHPLYSPGTAALLIAMTALQRADGVPPAVGFENALEAWREHTRVRGNDTWEYSELVAVVDKLTTTPGSGP